jgi:hypothetical protein
MKARGVYAFDFGDNEMSSLNPATLQELRAAGFVVSAYSALHPRSMNSAIEYLGVDAMETDFPPVLRNLMPVYVTSAAAAALSDGAAEITWTSFPEALPVSEIKVRAKRKAAAPSTWTTVAAGRAFQWKTRSRGWLATEYALRISADRLRRCRQRGRFRQRNRSNYIRGRLQLR